MPGRECLTGPYLHYRLLLLALITDWSFFFRLSEPERPVCCFKLNFEMVSLVTDGRKSKLRHLFYGASLQRKENCTTERCTSNDQWAAVCGSRHLGQDVKVIHRQLSVSLGLPLFNQLDNSGWQGSSAKYRLLAGHCCHGTGTSSAVGRPSGKKQAKLKLQATKLGQNPSNISRD